MTESININLSLKDIIQALKPDNYEQLLSGNLSNASVSQITTDSRVLSKGAVFIALRGEQFDGHDYLADCFAQGAVAAVVTESCLPVDIKKTYADKLFLVDDTLLAYGLIAKAYRRKLNCPVIALTGSAGKTTTKEMLAAILRQLGKVSATQANFNNEIGVPKTLLEIQADTDFAIVEMGAAKAGDIAYLMDFVNPDVSILTNAYAAHIEGFGSLDVIAETKGEIFSCQAKGKFAIINDDDQYAAFWKDKAAGKQKISFSLNNKNADVFADNIYLNSGLSSFDLVFQATYQAIDLPCSGIFNVANALAASAAAISLGVSLENIAKGLAGFKNIEGRLQIHCLADGLILDDSYNANPEAMRAAIEALMSFPGDKALVLGAMAELGEHSKKMHEQLAQFALEQDVQQVYFYGDDWPDDASVFCKNLNIKTIKNIKDKTSLLNEIQSNWQVKQNVLIKGSRSMRMETLVQDLILNQSNKQQGAC